MRLLAILLVAVWLTACRTHSVRRCAPAPCPVVQADVPPPAPTWTPVRELEPEPSLMSRVRATRVSELKFVEPVPLTRCVEFLTVMTGIQIVLTPEAAKKAENAEVQLALNNVGMADVLDLVTQPYDLRWSAHGDEVRVVPHDPTLRLRFYDVKDLQRYHDKLEQAASEVVKPEAGASAELRNGILIVRASGESLASVDRQLTELRRKMAK